MGWHLYRSSSISACSTPQVFLSWIFFFRCSTHRYFFCGLFLDVEQGLDILFVLVSYCKSAYILWIFKILFLDEHSSFCFYFFVNLLICTQNIARYSFYIIFFCIKQYSVCYICSKIVIFVCAFFIQLKKVLFVSIYSKIQLFLFVCIYFFQREQDTILCILSVFEVILINLKTSLCDRDFLDFSFFFFFFLGSLDSNLMKSCFG